MKNIASYKNAIKEFSDEQIMRYSEELNSILNNEIIKESKYIENYVDNIKRQS